ncbi:hypothetical protein BURKHO8Y_110462 [Burkholderia sp. 8Y]|nr:hypothetical protein BURKHO8Y_110462 [Burkholderia sp. 8Y]
MHRGRSSAGHGEVHPSRSRLRGVVPVHVGIACARHPVHARFLRSMRPNLRCLRRRMQPSYRQSLSGVQRCVPEGRGGVSGAVKNTAAGEEHIHSFCAQPCGQARDARAIRLTRRTNFRAFECAPSHGTRRSPLLPCKRTDRGAS